MRWQFYDRAVKLDGGLSELDWGKLKIELSDTKPKVTDAIIKHAKDNDGFFSHNFEIEPELEKEEF